MFTAFQIQMASAFQLEAGLLGARLGTMGCPLCLDAKDILGASHTGFCAARSFIVSEPGSTRTAMLEWLTCRFTYAAVATTG